MVLQWNVQTELNFTWKQEKSDIGQQELAGKNISPDVMFLVG